MIGATLHEEAGHCVNSPGMAHRLGRSAMQNDSTPTPPNPEEATPMTIVISRWYADAAYKFATYWHDWRWFAAEGDAFLWIDRCSQRGVNLHVTWAVLR